MEHGSSKRCDHPHYCYVLYNTKQLQRTYVGYTTNPNRRLRQHNGLISGGARATSGTHEWAFLFLVTSPSFNTHTGLSFEWHLKRALKTQKAKGPVKRIESLFKTIIQNTKFNQYEFQIYISMYAQNVFPEMYISELSRPNITVFDTIADVT